MTPYCLANFLLVRTLVVGLLFALFHESLYELHGFVTKLNWSFENLARFRSFHHSSKTSALKLVEMIMILMMMCQNDAMLIKCAIYIYTIKPNAIYQSVMQHTATGN
jgi:hypothetical protein